MNILISGHACLPNAGSELGVTWNWAWNLAADNRVWVITHGSFRDEIEAYLRRHPRPGLSFVWVGPFGRWDPWKPPSPSGIRLHYFLWRRAALRAGRDLIRVQRIDLVHHISWCTLSAPPLLWKLEKPFVWGPVGGGQIAPWRFARYLGRDVGIELIRTIRVKLMPINPILRRTIAHTDLLLAANRETWTVLTGAGARRLAMFSDVGASPEEVAAAPGTKRQFHGHLNLVWAGRIENFKGLRIALDALKRVRSPEVRLLIAGDGPQRRWSEAYAKKHGLAGRVRFLGNLPWAGLQQLFSEAHLLLFTSLRETFGSVILEAMAKGCPVICFDRCGAATHLPSDAAIKLDVTSARQAVEDLARAIEHAAAHPAGLRALSQKAYLWAGSQRWDERAATMADLYREMLEAKRMAAFREAVPAGSGMEQTEP